MKQIKINKNNFKLIFEINDSNHIALTYIGKSENLLNKPSSIVEIETSEGDHLGSHCAKQCNTPFAKNAKYISHKQNDNELIIVTSDNIFEVETHFKFYDNVSGLSIYSKIHNITNNDVHLEYVSSFYLYGLGQKESPVYRDMNVYYASSSWHTECQWKKQSFIDANIFNGNDRLTMKRFIVGNVGSWSTKDYLPMLGIENIKQKQFLLMQIEHNGSWHFEIGDNENSYYVSVCGPTMNDAFWCQTLKPNEEFITVPVSISVGEDFEESVQEITKLRRYIVKTDHVDYKNQPVIFNDFMHGLWDLSSEELIKPLVNSAYEVGCDTFVLDAGWFAKGSGWTNYIGEYKEYSENFPNGGLRGLFDYIRSKGLKTGLWFEIENVGSLSAALKTMPEEFFMHINGHRVMKNSRYCLNLCNKGAFNWAYDKITSAIDKYDLDYIKVDYNLDLGPGNNDEDKFLGVGLLKHNQKVIELIRKIESNYPNLTIENCASGGQRLDYAMLKETQLVSSSDLENYYFYPYISGNMYTACLPEQAGIWAYPVCNDLKKFDITDEVVIFNMANGLTGRLTLSSKLYNLSNTQLELVKEAVKLAKELTEFRKKALPIYPNGFNRYFNDDVVTGLMDEERIILYVFNMTHNSNDIEIDLSKYNALSFKQIYPCNNQVEASLENGKMKIRFSSGLMGRVFELKRL